MFKFSKLIIILSIVLCICSELDHVLSDVIMMNGNGEPSIVENDDFEQDVILMPGMGSMIINDDLVL